MSWIAGGSAVLRQPFTLKRCAASPDLDPNATNTLPKSHSWLSSFSYSGNYSRAGRRDQPRFFKLRQIKEHTNARQKEHSYAKPSQTHARASGWEQLRCKGEKNEPHVSCTAFSVSVCHANDPDGRPADMG